MNNNEFTLNIIARLNKRLSKGAINNDLKTLDNTMYVKVLAKLSKTLASRELKRQLKELDNLNVNVGIKTKNNKDIKNKIQQNIQSLQKTISDLEIGLKTTKLDTNLKTIQNNVRQKVNRTPVDFNLQIKKEKAIADIEYIGKKYSKLFSNISASKKYENILNSAYGISDAQNLNNVRAQISAFTSELKSNGLAAQSTGDRWRKLIDRSKELFSAATVIRSIFVQVKQAVSTSINLDKVYTDLIKVNDELERNDYADYLSRCNKKAQELATTQKALIEGATEFSKSGYNLDTSDKLTEKSTILSNVGEMSASDSAKAIISGVQAYETVDGYTDVVNKAEALIDKYNEIGNTASITTSEIAQGVQSVGSVFADANTSVDKFIALLSAGNRQYQDADALALGLRTSALRIRGCTTELEAMGEETDNVCTSASKLEEKIQGLTNINETGGVKILESDGKTFRDIYEIFLDISKVYKDMSDVDQSALLELIAGKHRASAISATLNNMTEAETILQNSLNASGSAQREYDTYLESTEAHLQQFQAKLVETYSGFINGNMVSDAADLGTALLNLVNSTDLLKHSLTAIATLKIGQGIAAIGGAVSGTITQMNTLGNALQQVKNLPLDDVLRENSLKQMGEETKNLTEKNLKLLLSQKQLTEDDKIAILVKHDLTKEQAKEKLETLGLTTATNANTAANKANAASVNKSKGAFTGLRASIKATWSAMSGLQKASVIFAAVSTAWSIASSIISNIKQSAEEARQAAQEAAKEYGESSKSIDEYVKKYNDLRDALIKAKGNEEETYNIKKQLLELQTELNDKFGDEYGKINLVTDAYKDQTEAIKNYNKEAANKFQNEHRDEIKEAKRVMESKDTYVLSMPLSNEGNDKKFLDLAKQYEDRGIYVEESIQRVDTDPSPKHKWEDKTVYTIKLNADPQSAYDTINAFATDIRDLSKDLGNENLFYDALMYEELDNSKDKLEKYKEIYEESQITNIVTDENLSTGYNEAVSAVEKYNEAVLKSEDAYNDKNVKAAWDNMQKIKQEMLDNEDWTQYSNILNNIFSAAEDKTYEFYNLLQNDFSLKGLLNELQGLSDIDLKSMFDDGTEGENYDAFDRLYEKAQKYGLELQDIIELLIRMGIIQGSIAKGENENNTQSSIPKTFSEAWKFIGKSGDEKADKTAKEAKEKLLELAESGKLTTKEFLKSPLADYFKETGLSVDEVIEKINKMKSSASQLSSMKTGISSISSILGEKKENLSSKKTRNVGIGADTLNAMPDDIKAQKKEYKEFIKVLGDGSSTMDECKEAANKLATAYVNSNNFLANLTEGEQGYYTSILEEMGVKNAAKIVDDVVTANKQKQELKTRALEAATQDLGKETSDATDEFLKQTDATKLTRLELFELIAAEKIFGNNDLSTDEKVKELNKLAEKYLGVSAIIQTSAMFADPRYYANEEARQQAIIDREKEIEDTYNELIESQRKAILGNVDIDENGGKKNKGKDKDKKKSTQQFDWISRALDRLSSKLDLVKAKYENLFSNPKVNDSDSLLKARNKNLKEQYKILEKTAKYQEKAQKKYKKKADGIKLDDSLKKAVREGRIKGSQKELIAKYGEKKAEKIQQYQDWYDKSQEQQKNLESTKTAMHENRSQRIQSKIDYTESKRSDLQAKRENVFSAKDKNSYIADEIEVVKDLYNYQIKLAKSEKDTLEVSRLRAEKEKEIRDLKNEQHQSNIDELEPFLDLLSAKKENANSASEKNSIIDKELEITRQIYAEKKAISENPEEIDRLDEEFRSKKKQAVIEKGENIEDEYDNKLAALDREEAKTEARIKKNAALGIGQSRKDYAEQIEFSEKRKNILAEKRNSLEAYLEEQIALGNVVRDDTDPAYKSLMDSISECDTGIADCVTEQINYNKSIKEMDIENYKTAVSLLDSMIDKYKRLQSLADVHNSKLSDEDILAQISLNDEKIVENEKYLSTIKDNIKSYLTDELHMSAENVDKFINLLENAPHKIRGFMNDLGFKDFNEKTYPDLINNLNEYNSTMNDTNSIMVEQENQWDSLAQKRIDTLNEYLEALKKQKDYKDRIFAIEKAQYELNKAKNNLTKKVWDGQQWVYTADTEAIQSAQENLDNLQYEELVNVLENLIEALEQFKKDMNLYDDHGNKINSVDDIRGKIEPLNEIDKIFKNTGIDLTKVDFNKALENLMKVAPQLQFDIPNYEVPNYNNISNNISNNNPINIQKIEMIMPNITNESTAKDLMNQLSSLGTYAKQYNWNK